MHVNHDPETKLQPAIWRRGLVATMVAAALILLMPALAMAQAAAGGGADEEVTALEVERSWPDDLSKPPDGNWLIDDKGLEYFTFELPKKGLRYSRVNDEMIRMARGPHLRIAGETEDAFTVKIVNHKSVPMPRAPSKPTLEQIAKSNARYKVSVPEVDRFGFEAVDKGLPRSGLWRNGFDVADMNGDGHLDIVHGPARKSISVPVIFLGDGAGTWKAWEETSFPDAPYDYGDIVVADFNGDGKHDLGLAFHIRGMLALVGDGKGTFTAWSDGIGLERPGEEGRFPPFSSRAIEAVDWDRDGRVDLVALSEGPRGFEHVNERTKNGLVFYRNLGDGKWVRRVDDTSVIFGDKLSLADIEGDGTIEIVTSTNYSGERALVNRWQGGETGIERVTIDEVRPSALIWSSTAGDFDGDGRDDLVVAYRNRELGTRRTGIDVLFAREDGSWERKGLLVRDLDPTHVDIHALATGDVDADGDLDLAATTRNGQLFLFLGDGKGGFERETEKAFEEALSGCRGYGLEMANLDAEPGDEIIASFSGEACPQGGSIRAWRVTPKAAPPAAAP